MRSPAYPKSPHTGQINIMPSNIASPIDACDIALAMIGDAVLPSEASQSTLRNFLSKQERSIYGYILYMAFEKAFYHSKKVFHSRSLRHLLNHKSDKVLLPIDDKSWLRLIKRIAHIPTSYQKSIISLWISSCKDMSAMIEVENILTGSSYVFVSHKCLLKIIAISLRHIVTMIITNQLCARELPLLFDLLELNVVLLRKSICTNTRWYSFSRNEISFLLAICILKAPVHIAQPIAAFIISHRAKFGGSELNRTLTKAIFKRFENQPLHTV